MDSTAVITGRGGLKCTVNVIMLNDVKLQWWLISFGFTGKGVTHLNTMTPLELCCFSAFSFVSLEAETSSYTASLKYVSLTLFSGSRWFWFLCPPSLCPALSPQRLRRLFGFFAPLQQRKVAARSESLWIFWSASNITDTQEVFHLTLQSYLFCGLISHERLTWTGPASKHKDALQWRTNCL